jgi:hypothetical protein
MASMPKSTTMFKGRPASVAREARAKAEGSKVMLELYHARSRTAKFVPVIFARGDERFIPAELSGYTHYLLTSEDQYFQLYAFLTNQAGVVPVELGTLKALARESVAPLRFGWRFMGHLTCGRDALVLSPRL